MKRRFAYLKLHVHAINASIQQTLAASFPWLEMDVIDVGQLVKKRRDLVLINLFFVFIEYGLEILLGRKKIRECFWRTPFIFKAIKRLLPDTLTREHYDFSIQNQSMFDGSREGLPHFVYTDHTHLANLRYPGYQRKNMYGKSWIKLERQIYHHAVINFTRSNYATESIVQDYGCSPSKVVCVYAGSNPVPNPVINLERYSKKEILFVGMDWERKGGPDLVKAFKLVLNTYPDARLSIVGCSPKLKQPNCSVIGKVSREEVNRYYDGASVFCLPTRLEPLGISFLEALNHGLPIVATDIASIPDFVIKGQTGYCVKPGDIEQLSTVLVELLDNPRKCLDLGENGRRLAMSRYTWDRVGAEMARYITASISS